MTDYSLIKKFITAAPKTRARNTYDNEQYINPAYYDIEHCPLLAVNETRIWVLREDLILALGIKNAPESEKNTRLTEKIAPSLHSYFDHNDRYGHPSLTMPQHNSPVYYAGWLRQNEHHLTLYIHSGRYQNKELNSWQKTTIEHYIAMQLIDAFGEQDILFYDRTCEQDSVAFFKNKALIHNRSKRVYCKTLIENSSPLLCPEPNLTFLNKIDADGFTFLLRAAAEGNITLVEHLIECGVDVNLMYQKKQFTALDFACQNGHFNVCQLLMKANARAQQIHSQIDGDSIYDFIQRGYLEGVRLLLYINETLLNKPNEQGITPLNAAILNQKVDIVSYLVQEKKALINSYVHLADLDYPSLDLAYGMMNEPIIQLLLQQGARAISAIDNQEHFIYFHINQGDLERVALYVHYEPECLDIKNTHGLTPIMYAKEQQQDDIIRFLQQKINPNESITESDLKPGT